jgi:hypothetical protein
MKEAEAPLKHLPEYTAEQPRRSPPLSFVFLPVISERKHRNIQIVVSYILYVVKLDPSHVEDTD